MVQYVLKPGDSEVRHAGTSKAKHTECGKVLRKTAVDGVYYCSFCTKAGYLDHPQA